jgi:hypothetical protein
VRSSIDCSREFLLDPEAMLRAICARLEVEFVPKMLTWPSGVRDSVWENTGMTRCENRPASHPIAKDHTSFVGKTASLPCKRDIAEKPACFSYDPYRAHRREQS